MLFFGESRANLTTNKVLIDSALSDFSLSLLQKLDAYNIDAVILQSDDNFPSYFLDNITNTLIQKGKKIFTKIGEESSTKYLRIKLFQKKFDIRYELNKDEGYSRNFDFEIIVFKIDKSGEISELLNFQTNAKDELTSSELQGIEDANFPITKGKVPSKKSSWLDEVLEPVVIISASIVSVVLFFTVRSK
jgi:hypothetical protein